MIRQFKELEQNYAEILITFAKDLKNFLYLETIPESNYLKNVIVIVKESIPEIQFESKVLKAETNFNIEYEITENKIKIKNFGDSIKLGEYYLILFNTIEFQSKNIYEIFGKNLVNYFSFDSDIYKNTLKIILNLLVKGPVKNYFKSFFDIEFEINDFITKNNWWEGKVIKFKKKFKSVKSFSDNVLLNKTYLIPGFKQLNLINSGICISHEKKFFSDNMYFGDLRFNPRQYFYGSVSFSQKFMEDIGKHHLFNVHIKNEAGILNNDILFKTFLSTLSNIKTISSKQIIDFNVKNYENFTITDKHNKNIIVNLTKKDIFNRDLIFSNSRRYLFGTDNQGKINYFKNTSLIDSKNVTLAIKLTDIVFNSLTYQSVKIIKY
ncbi:MAG: hypothetical protein QXX30_02235 [Candidatus Aenigmatarchaeota archaeon]